MAGIPPCIGSGELQYQSQDQLSVLTENISHILHSHQPPEKTESPAFQCNGPVVNRTENSFVSKRKVYPV